MKRGGGNMEDSSPRTVKNRLFHYKSMVYLKPFFFPMLVIMYRIQVGMPFLVLSILRNLPETIIFIEAL